VGTPGFREPIPRSDDSNGAGYPLDARHNQLRIERQLIALGRDAVDIALTAALGTATSRSSSSGPDETPGPDRRQGRHDAAEERGTAPLTH
jgi:hypothetical protein